MKIIAFISNDCKNCDLWKKLLHNEQFPFLTKDDNISLKYIDAFDENTQDFCDKHQVDELPHIKIIDDGKVIFDEIGFSHPRKLWKILYPMMVIKEKIAKFNLSKFNK